MLLSQGPADIRGYYLDARYRVDHAPIDRFVNDLKVA